MLYEVSETITFSRRVEANSPLEAARIASDHGTINADTYNHDLGYKVRKISDLSPKKGRATVIKFELL